MTAHDILKIAITVSTTQCICDLLSNHFVYKSESYQKLQSSYTRAKTKHAKAVESAPKSITSNTAQKKDKKLQRLEDDMNNISAEVARRHVTPTFLTSITFLILYRVLSTEYSGKVIAVLPFEPFWLLQKVTSRGLYFDVELLQDGANASTACSFAFVYLLCTLSCKFMVSRIFGYNPPNDTSMTSVLDAPKNQKLLKSMGVDKEEYIEAKQILGWK